MIVALAPASEAERHVPGAGHEVEMESSRLTVLAVVCAVAAFVTAVFAVDCAASAEDWAATAAASAASAVATAPIWLSIAAMTCCHQTWN